MRNMTNSEYVTYLREQQACAAGIAFAEQHGGDAAAIWDALERLDWLLWQAGRCPEVTQAQLVHCAADCAETVAHLNTDPRVMAAINAARAWADNPTEENRQAAAWAAKGHALRNWAWP